MKKADLSMNTIVGAAIAVLILVVVIIIVTRQLGDKNAFIKDCEPNHGTCVAKSTDGTNVCSQNGENGLPGAYSCANTHKSDADNYICCTYPLGKGDDTTN